LSSPTPVPHLDLARQYHTLAAELRAAVQDVLPRGKYTLGPQLAAFEQEFAAYSDCRFGVGVASGTAALHLALLALDIGPGDEVITACNTYTSTAFAISHAGAQPVFVDVERDTFNMDLDRVAEKITPRTRAVIPVHLYGQPVEMDALADLARRHDLALVEDASHAHGALYRGGKAGSLGRIGCFSLYPTKVLGAYGDAGIVTTNDARAYERIRQLRYLGQQVQHLHEVIGYQERLDELQAAMLRVKLRHLDRWLARRHELARLYDERLAPLGLIPPRVAPDRTHSYYMYTVRVPDGRRDALREWLAAREIGTLVVYPRLVPFQPAYASLGHRPGDFPVAESLLSELLCLPFFPELTGAEFEAVVAAISDFYSSR
jgi:dTDP-4-amino-4,6-dideoxygalactose transaminase